MFLIANFAPFNSWLLPKTRPVFVLISQSSPQSTADFYQKFASFVNKKWGSHRSQCCKMRLFIMICNHFVIRVNKVYLTKYGERVKEKRLRLAFFLGLQSQMARLYQKPLAQYSILATEEYYTWAYNWVLRPAVVMVEPPSINVI